MATKTAKVISLGVHCHREGTLSTVTLSKKNLISQIWSFCGEVTEKVLFLSSLWIGGRIGQWRKLRGIPMGGGGGVRDTAAEGGNIYRASAVVLIRQ